MNAAVILRWQTDCTADEEMQIIGNGIAAGASGNVVRTLLFACLTFAARAQGNPGSLAGVITDPTRAVVPNADITLTGAGGFTKQVSPDEQGRFTIKDLPPGGYRLHVVAEGFVEYEIGGLQVRADDTITHNVHLLMASVRQEVTVDESSAQLDVNPSNNAGAVVLSGADLSALSDDPDDLAADLQALAGPGAGPDGGAIFIDGFSGGKLPPKSSIREVRVNQNPFSAEYDRLGFGRIEIFTKPGTDNLRGEAMFNFGDSMFNSRNPFALEKPESQRRMIEGNLAGPINSKTSFLFDFERRDIQETVIVNALTVDSSFNFAPFRQAVITPTTNTEFNLRLDRQLSTNHTLVGRFNWEDRTQSNAGLDTFSLPTRAFERTNRDHILQLTETAIISANAINEARFQYIRSSSASVASNTDSAVQVPEAFISGGAAIGSSAQRDNRWEFTNMLSWMHKRHSLKFGGRLRGVLQSDQSMQNYNGMFTFNSLDAYRNTLLGIHEGLTAGQIRAMGGGASQFTITNGNPAADVAQVDTGIFVQDDWRILPQLTLTGGVRYEFQSNIGDRKNVAPRLAFAWAPGGANGRAPLAVIRGGFGMFYDRVSESLTLQAMRLDGVRQQQYLVPNADFFPIIPPTSTLAGNIRDQAVRVLDRNIRSPYVAQFALSVERQLAKSTTLSVTYANSRGVRVLRSRNINAPLPSSGIHPFDGGNVYLYESTGFYRQNQLIANINARLNRRLNLFGYYTWSRANSDTDGAGSFPANQYDAAAEYGRAGFDVRHRVFLGGSLLAPYGLQFSPFITASSGPPFNISTGRDLNGDSIFNDRPAWATDLSRPSVVRTAYGVFDSNPAQAQTIIPRNIGDGPGQFTVNLRLARSFGFGEKSEAAGGAVQQGGPGGGIGGHGGGHGGWHMPGPATANNLYSVTISVSARNLFNTVNLAPTIGNLSSQAFGTSVATAGRSSANRSLEFQMRFSF